MTGSGSSSRSRFPTRWQASCVGGARDISPAVGRWRASMSRWHSSAASLERHSQPSSTLCDARRPRPSRSPWSRCAIARRARSACSSWPIRAGARQHSRVASRRASSGSTCTFARRRPWLPHITVLRFRERPGLDPPLPTVGRFTPSGAAALLSRLHPSGARYEVLESCSLGTMEPGGRDDET